MPVGEADKGFSAEKGKVYYLIKGNLTYIDWWHEELGNEPFDHSGILSTYFIRPGLIYGLTDKLNIYINSTLGIRQMHWYGQNESIHHRDETSLTNYINAQGGLMGDSRLILRHLLRKTETGKGFRVYTGYGVTIPSKSVLTSDPFFLDGNEQKEHRHFSLSNGTYNGIIESQIFYRRIENPVFIGGFIFIEKPISESDFGYLPSTVTTISLSTSFMNFDQRESSIDYGLSLVHASQGYWNNLPAPNSKSLTVIPSIGYLFNSILGGISINLQKPLYISGAYASNEGDIEQTSSVWQLSFSMRFLTRSN